MTTRWGRFFRALALALALSCRVASARVMAQDEVEAPASDVARAESFAAGAFQAYADDDYARAVSLYQLALEAAPSADILYNLARIYDTKLHERARAQEYYQRYVDDPTADAARVITANMRLKQLSGEAQASSKSAVSRPAPAPAVHTRSAPVVMTGTRITAVVLSAVGLVAIGAGAGLAFSAKTDADVTHELCDGDLCISQRGVDAAHTAQAKANLATAGILGGGVLAAVGLTLFLIGAPSPETHSAALRFTPTAGRTGFGTQLAGRF